MTVRRRRAVAAMAPILVLAVIIAGCASPASSGVVSGAPSAAVSAPASASPAATDSSVPSDTASDSASPGIPDSPVAGIVVGVDSTGLDQVTGFTLRTNDGETIQFKIGTLENGDEFPPGHLKEHQTTAAPILVFFTSENGQLVVHRIEDAG